MPEKLNRRNFIEKSAALGATSIIASSIIPGVVNSTIKKTVSFKSSGKHKNVLLIISDDHGIDQLGCYGNKKIDTPNLDNMAARGIRFTNAYSTVASCSPSRASVLTGLYSHQNGQYGLQHKWHHFKLLDWVETAPSLLKKSGYKTGLVGKLHVESTENLEFDFKVSGKEIKGNRDVKKMADKAGEFFSQDKEKPFFLLVGYSDPHRKAPPKSKTKNASSLSGFGNDPKYEGLTAQKYDPADVHVPGFLPDIPEVRNELADQYESISRLDTGIGWMIDNLKKSGRYDDTLIIYLSDNGIPFPGAKTTVYDSGVKLPMIINSPGIKKGGIVNKAMISFVDLLPTILDWTDAKPPKYKLPGKSFRNLLNSEDSSERNEIYNSHTFHEVTMFYPMRSIRTRRYRYILNLYPQLEFPFATDLFASKTWQAILNSKLEKMGKRSTRNYLYRPAEELYDIQNDPAESVNLAGDSNYKTVLNELRTKLRQMREDTDDYWLINDNYKTNSEVFKR